MKMGALVPLDAENTLALAREPAIVLEEAHRAARALKDVIDAKPNKVMFGGHQYLEYEDWSCVARFYGIAARNTGSRPITIGDVSGWEASADAIHVETGRVVSSADAMCLNDEEKWRARPKYEWLCVTKTLGLVADPPKHELIWERGQDGKNRPKKERVHVGEEHVPSFQLRSMAQTRAGAKALRNALAWVVVLAGYRPTPAEELSQVDAPPRQTPKEGAEDADFTPPPRAMRAEFTAPSLDVEAEMDAAMPEINEEQERSLLLGKVKACADKLKYDAKVRAGLWDEFVTGDPRTAPIEKLNDLYAHLKGLAG